MKSRREEVQQQIVDQIDLNVFNAPYGCRCGKAHNQKYRTVSIGIEKTLDIEIRIYGPRFILVKWTTVYRRLPPVGTEKCETVEQVIGFLRKNFYDRVPAQSATHI